MRVLEGHDHWVTSVCMTADGRSLVTGSRDTTAKLWALDEDDGALVRTFKGHHGAVSAVCATADGRHLLTASWDGTVRRLLLSE